MCLKVYSDCGLYCCYPRHTTMPTPMLQSGDEKSYWSALMPDAAQAHAAAVAAAKAGPIILAPRRRRKVDYAEEVSLG